MTNRRRLITTSATSTRGPSFSTTGFSTLRIRNALQKRAPSSSLHSLRRSSWDVCCNKEESDGGVCDDESGDDESDDGSDCDFDCENGCPWVP